MKLEIDLNNLDKETLIQIIKNQQGMLGTKQVAVDIDFKVTPILAQQITEYFGNQTKLARLLGVSQASISKWSRGEEIPNKERKKQITDLSGGQIKFYNVGEVI